MNDKALKPIQTQTQRVEVVANKKQEKEIKLLNTIFPHAGHRVFELNLETYVISEVEYMQQTVKYEDAVKGVASLNKKVMTKPNHRYVSALNKKNAAKKFLKDFGSWLEIDADNNLTIK